MIKIYIWLPTNKLVGHAAAQILTGNINEYISWHPGEEQTNVLKSEEGRAFTLQEDAFKTNPPQEVIQIDGLDEQKALDWWIGFKNDSKSNYNLATSNCSTVVARVLKAGGSNDFFPWFRILEKYNQKTKLLSGRFINDSFSNYIHKMINILQDKDIKNENDEDISVKERIILATKMPVVQILDEYSSYWSPTDLLNYCCLLKQGMAGEENLQTYLFGNLERQINIFPLKLI